MKNKILIIFLLLFASKIYSTGISLVSPVNNFNQPTFNVNFSWNPITNQTSYRIKIAQDPSFQTIIKDVLVTQASAQINLSSALTEIYWKVVTDDLNGHAESEVYKLNFINPSQNPNLLLWLAADSNTVTNPDGTISSWNNIVPNGLNGVQANASSQPMLVNDEPTINNLKSVRFDGIDDFFQINSSGSIGSIYVFNNWKGTGNFPSFNGMLSQQSIVSFDSYLLMGSPGTPLLFNNTYFTSNASSTYVNGVLGSDQTPLANFKVTSGRRGTNIRSFPNLTIGRTADPAAYWNGNLTEMIISKNNTQSESDSIHTYLYNKYAPPITMRDTVVGSNLCSSVVVSAPKYYVSYLWSTGATTSSISALPGKYSIKGKDIFGRESTTSFNVYPYIRLNNITVTICQGDTFKVDLKTPVGFTALWNTGNNTTKINITTTGRYTVTITNGACSINDTINVVVDVPKLSITPVAGRITMCEGEKLYVNSFSGFDSIRWSTGSSAEFITVTTSGNYSVFARNASGCVINQNFDIVIAGKAPSANFSYSTLCEKTDVVFTDLSTPPTGININNWKWNFSNNTNATTQNPSARFDTTGTFSAALKITTTQGCSDSIFKTFNINRKPVARFSNRKSCEGNPTTFEDLSTPNAATITNWKWNFDNIGIINDIQNPAFVFPSANTYNVNLLVTNTNGCTDTITNQVKVNKSPVSNFSFDAVCGKSPVNFRFLATVPTSPTPPQPTIASWQWDFGDNTFNTSIKDVSHVYATTGIYNVKLSVISSDQCPNVVEKQVKVYEYPIVDFDISPTQCTGKDIQFTDLSQTIDGTPITSWKWYFSGQARDTMKNTSYVFNTEGNYTVQLTAANAVGCTGTKLRNVAVSAPPVPQFTFSPNGVQAGATIVYTNQSPSNGNYIWNYGDNSPEVVAYNPPSHIYQANGTYPITLTATNFRGCTGTLTKQILVGKAYLDGVVTSITIIPNGDYYQIQATILNASNVEIRDLGLSIQLGGGAVIRENWTGSLLPGQTTIYNFIGQIKVSDAAIPVVCTSIDNVNNNSPEDRIDNNTTCKEIRVGSFDVLNIYPNPAYESINFGVMLPKDGKVTIGFIDMLGQIMYKQEFNGVRGYNKLTMNTTQLNAAVYVAVITFDGEIIRQKFMRRDIK